MARHSGQYIQNNWVAGSGERFTSLNPATQEVIWEGETAEASEVVYALKSAREAFLDWSELAIEKRLQYIRQFSQQLERKSDELAEIISREVGKPLWESKLEVKAMIGKIDISIEAYNERCKDKELDIGFAMSVVKHKPIGVMVVIGPFNFPGHLPNGHIIPALIAGNTIVFKPSDHTPLVGETMMKYWQMAGLPKGVINMVQGGVITGQLLVTHPEVDGLLFTGSASVGKQLASLFGRHPEKILALEMGGNNPMIVSKITDIPAAVYNTIQSAFITSGQRCTCTRRLILVKSETSDQFIKALIEATKKLEVGSYSSKLEPFMGPVISNEIASFVESREKWLQNMGGKSLLKTSRPDSSLPIIRPGIIDVSLISSLPDEEIFGPLLQIIEVKDFYNAILEANRTKFGLAAVLLSDDVNEYQQFYKEIKAGIINWNVPSTGASSKAPFGGIGQSGNFRPSAYYAADYCSYPVASIQKKSMSLPESLTPGVIINDLSQPK